MAKRGVDAMLSNNSKIAGSNEIFIMANDSQDVQNISMFNDPVAQAIKGQRQKILNERGRSNV